MIEYRHTPQEEAAIRHAQVEEQLTTVEHQLLVELTRLVELLVQDRKQPPIVIQQWNKIQPLVNQIRARRPGFFS